MLHIILTMHRIRRVFGLQRIPGHPGLHQNQRLDELPNEDIPNNILIRLLPY